jgi:hypothetical protein
MSNLLDKLELLKASILQEDLYSFIKIAGKIEDLQLKYPNFDIANIASHDPSPTKKYLLWMIKQLEKGHAETDLFPTIGLFHKNQHKLPNKDIEYYKDLKDLEDILKEISSSKSKREITKDIKSNASKIYEDNQVLVIRPDSKQACQIYGANTQWCITMQNASYYEQYTQSNVVFYFIINKIKRDDAYNKVALAYQRGLDNKILQLDIYDEKDKQVNDLSGVFDNIGTILSKTKSDAESRPKSILAKIKSNEASHEEINDVLSNGDIEVIAHILKDSNLDINKLNNENKQLYLAYKQPEKYLDIASERTQLIVVKQHVDAIRYIENPSEQVQLEAVKRYGHAIRCIKNPSEQVQLEAVKQYEYAIGYIENPSEQVQLEAVKRYGNAIRCIKNPSEQVQLEAVKQYGHAIGYIENPSEQVQLEAVKQYEYAIGYIENPSEQVQLEAVKRYGHAIEYIENPSSAVIDYVKNKRANVNIKLQLEKFAAFLPKDNSSLLSVPGIKGTSISFRNKLIDIAKKLNTNPDFLATVISFETGGSFNPAQKNKAGSGATGLIQFMPDTAKGLGTTVEDLANMSAEQQLDYVYKYYSRFHNLNTLHDIYMATLYPAAIGKKDDQVLFKDPDIKYKQNIGFDKEHKGYVTVGDVSGSITGRYNAAKGERIDINQPPTLNTVPIKSVPDNDIEAMMQKLYASGPVEALVKKSIARKVLPTNKYLIIVEGEILPIKIKTANILISALREDLDADVSLHKNEDEIHINCELYGSRENTELAVKAMCKNVLEVLNNETSAVMYYNKTSSFDLISLDTLNRNNRILNIAKFGK